ncbi:hypothetical protein BACERE00185_04530 [Bacillus mobilis]|uniref:IrrE N-terminal-like domain-containing protein n=1 Tax=Bacillus mobilis TaxID=2026190 RepID=A0A1Y6AKY1_9BACI|nr:hypothetical protein [Bacillus mobilis]SME38945.1 hypothetical protein BACERE00185_04530 [Bacillus mobilis]
MNYKLKKKIGFIYNESKSWFENILELANRREGYLKEKAAPFKQSCWENKEDYEQKEIIGNFIDEISGFMGLSAVPDFSIGPLKENAYGMIDKKAKCISLNENYINDGEGMAGTIVHELAHAYQVQVVTDSNFIKKLANYLDEKKMKKALLKVNPKRFPVEKFIEEMEMDQEELEYEQYIELLIEINAFETEKDFAEIMFGRMTNMQAQKYVTYNGKYNFGFAEETSKGKVVSILPLKKGFMVFGQVIDLDKWEFKFYVVNVMESYSYEYSEYSKAYDKYVELTKHKGVR